MDVEQVRQAVRSWFAGQDFAVQEDITIYENQIDLAVQKEESRWLVALMGDEDDAHQYSINFDAAVARLIAVAAEMRVPVQLALGVAFTSTQSGAELSYRRILKKYSNSIIFEDLDIHILLVLDDGGVEDVIPAEVNNFLRVLNEYIASQGEV